MFEVKFSLIRIVSISLILINISCNATEKNTFILRQTECSILIDSSFINNGHIDAIDYSVFLTIQIVNPSNSELKLQIPCCNIESNILARSADNEEIVRYKIFGFSNENILTSPVIVKRNDTVEIIAYIDDYVLYANQSLSQFKMQTSNKLKHQKLYFELGSEILTIEPNANIYNIDNIRFVDKSKVNIKSDF